MRTERVSPLLQVLLLSPRKSKCFPLTPQEESHPNGIPPCLLKGHLDSLCLKKSVFITHKSVMPQAPGSCKRYSGHGSRLDAEVPSLKQGLLQALKWAVLFFFFQYLLLFIYLAAPVLTCSLWDLMFPDQGSNLGPLHWQQGVLATGPPG